MTLSQFIPPIVYSAINSLKSDQYFNSYDEALQACASNGYEDSQLCEVVAEKTVLFARSIGEKPFRVSATSIFLVHCLGEFKDAAKGLTVVDFGGACGGHYFETRRFISADIKLRWYVIETPGMVSAAKQKGIETEDLRFLSDLEDLPSTIDFVYSSGAIQYVKDPYYVTKRLLNLQPKSILFNRMMFNRLDFDLITVQTSFLSTNGPGPLPKQYIDRKLKYPHTTLSFKSFERIFKHSPYRLELSFEEQSGIYNHKNADIFGAGLLYVRETEL